MVIALYDRCMTGVSEAYELQDGKNLGVKNIVADQHLLLL